MGLVVVEQQLEQPITASALASALESHAWCRGLHEIEHVQSILATTVGRMICVFDAPDLEAVRLVARKMGFSYERMWSGVIHAKAEAR